RLKLAASLQKVAEAGGASIGLFDEPGPFSMPPVNLFTWRLLLIPKAGVEMGDERELPDVLLRMTDRPAPPYSSPPSLAYQSLQEFEGGAPQLPGWLERFRPQIPFADKPFEVWVKRRLSRAGLAAADR
ncbi:MAG TPA: hypothetical protein VIL86_14760, partial [Tepidisphaeraceae bacterium]